MRFFLELDEPLRDAELAAWVVRLERRGTAPPELLARRPPLGPRFETWRPGTGRHWCGDPTNESSAQDTICGRTVIV
jgi:hypothetical protein